MRMSTHFSEEWMQGYLRRQSVNTEEPPKRKYRNEPVTDEDGNRYDSRKEKRAYDEFRLRGIGGEFRGLAKQVDFYLPGGIKYRADFVTLNNDGTYTVYDVKSEATRKDKVYIIKKKLMQSCHGIEVKEI